MTRAELDRLVDVVAWAVETVGERPNGSTYSTWADRLACGHELQHTGAHPKRRRCPDCGPLNQGQEALTW